MRLIDADALKGVMIETLEKIKANPKMDNQEAHVIAAFHTVGLMIDDAPTVDAVQVARCANCKWFDITEPSGTVEPIMFKCKRRQRFVEPDDFCKYGERREE